jgi:hypothetical protein
LVAKEILSEELQYAHLLGHMPWQSHDGILDPHEVATPELLPNSTHLLALQASGIEFELHLCFNTISPEIATAYVLAGVHTVTLHLESFWLPNGWGNVDFDKLIKCIEAIVRSCGRVGLCVYPTATLEEALVKLKKYGALQLISQITIIMDELVLASKVKHYHIYLVSSDSDFTHMCQLIRKKSIKLTVLSLQKSILENYANQFINLSTNNKFDELDYLHTAIGENYVMLLSKFKKELNEILPSTYNLVLF